MFSLSIFIEYLIEGISIVHNFSNLFSPLPIHVYKTPVATYQATIKKIRTLIFLFQIVLNFEPNYLTLKKNLNDAKRVKRSIDVQIHKTSL